VPKERVNKKRSQRKTGHVRDRKPPLSTKQKKAQKKYLEKYPKVSEQSGFNPRDTRIYVSTIHFILHFVELAQEMPERPSFQLTHSIHSLSLRSLSAIKKTLIRPGQGFSNKRRAIGDDAFSLNKLAEPNVSGIE